jgi:cyclophilin family peptidyl-prolyl cis-trans isomerase
MIASMAAIGLGNFGATPQPPPVFEDPELEPTPVNALTFPEGPAPVVDAARPHLAVIETNRGPITIELSTETPRAVNSFAFLAGARFYDGAIFFYASPELGAIAGDPTCTIESEQICSGLGGPGYSLALETSEASHDAWAVVAPFLAEGQPEVHGSQFRILYGPDPRLDGKETVFGRVVDGQEILEALSGVNCIGADPSSCAENTLVIQRVTVRPA